MQLGNFISGILSVFLKLIYLILEILNLIRRCLGGFAQLFNAIGCLFCRAAKVVDVSGGTFGGVAEALNVFCCALSRLAKAFYSLACFTRFAAKITQFFACFPRFVAKVINAIGGVIGTFSI